MSFLCKYGRFSDKVKVVNFKKFWKIYIRSSSYRVGLNFHNRYPHALQFSYIASTNYHDLLGLFKFRWLQTYTPLSNRDDVERILSIPEKKLTYLNTIHISDVYSAIKELENYRDSLLQNDVEKLSVLILKAVKRDFRPNENVVKKFWILLNSLQGIISENVVHNFLESCASSGYKINYEEFLSLMENHNLSMTQAIVELLLRNFCHHGDETSTNAVLSQYEAKGGKMNEAVYSALVILKGNLKDYQGTCRIHSAIKSANIPITSRFLSSLLVAYHYCSELDEARVLIDHLKNSVDFSVEEFYGIVRSLVYSGCATTNIDYFNYVLGSKEVLARDVDLRQLILQLIHSNYPREAIQILSTQSSYLIKPHENNSCSIFIKELVRSKICSSSIEQLCLDIIDKGINENAFCVALETALAERRVEASWALLRALKSNNLPVREHYFWPLFCFHFPNDDHVAKTLRIVDGVQELGVSLSSESLEKYVIPNLLPLESNPDLVLQMLSKRGISVTRALPALLSNLLHRWRMDDCLALVSKYDVTIPVDNLIPKIATTYKTSPEKSVQLLKFVLDKLQRREIDVKRQRVYSFVDKFIYEVSKSFDDESKTSDFNVLFSILKECGLPFSEENNSCFNVKTSFLPSSDHSSMEDEMSLDQLESHLIQLKEKAMNTRGVLRRLLFKYSTAQDKKNLSRILKELEEVSDDLSPGMQSSLLYKNVLEGNLDAALEAYILIVEKFPKFAIDSFKIVDLCSLIADKGDIQESLAILKEYAKKTPKNFHNQKSIQRNCHKLLTVCANKGNYSVLSDLCSTLIDYGLASPSPVILGPLVKIHLKKNDTMKAVEEGEKLFKQYKVLPMRLEILIQIMKLMILNKDDSSSSEVENNIDWNSVLERMMSLIKCSRGTRQANQDLLYATMETGDSEEALKVFQYVEGNLDKSMIRDLCNFFVRKENLNCLSMLFDISRGSVKVDRMYICNCLLNIYVVTRDYDSAMSLWSKMQDEQLRASPDFMTKISKLLGSRSENNL